MSKRKAVVKVAEGAIASVIVWFLGWLIYDLADLWQLMTLLEFRNLMLLLMCIPVLASVEWARKSAVSVTTIEKTSTKSARSRVNNPKPQADKAEEMPEWAQQMQKDINELAGKVADISALSIFKTKRQEVETDA